jgi:PilZ domain-containing protein
MILAKTYKQYEEQRKYPRLRLDVPVIILCVGQQLIEGRIYDISPDGLQIRCNREAALAINPGAKQISVQDKIMVNVIFSLPSNTGNKQIKVISNVYYFTLTQDGSDKDVAFGLQFKKFDGTGDRYVENFIMHALEPAE